MIKNLLNNCSPKEHTEDNENNLKKLKDNNKNIEENRIIKEKEDKLNEDISNREKEMKEKEDKLNEDISNREKKMKEKEDNLNNYITNKEKEIQEKFKMNLMDLKKEKDEIKKEKEDTKKEKDIIKKELNAIKLEKELIEKEKKNIRIIKNDFEKEKVEIKINKENIKKEREDIQKIKKNLEKKNLPILVGLDNIGATCYMNATLQSLSNTDKLTEYFFTKFKYEPGNQKKIISNEYYKLLTNLYDENKTNKSFPPNDFKKIISQENPLFKGIQANDSKDLINFLIERLHKELNIKQVTDNNNIFNVNQLNENEALQFFLQDFQINFRSIISDLFYGVLETKTKCLGCQNIKYNFQVYSFIEFPLEQVNIYCYQNGQRNFINNNGKNPDINIYECFEYYRKIDMMSGDNQMYCNICNCLQNAFYSTSLYSTPEYLIINLNRGKNAIYECKVIFPELLNILNYVEFKSGVTVYKLYAVICHYGPSSMSGHFMAYCRNSKDNKWYLYNDSIVNQCTKTNQYYDGIEMNWAVCSI